MELNIIDSKKALAVNDGVFGQKYKQDLVHQVVTAFRNAGRAGTKAQLTRAEVSGGNKKPFKQKGTGGARAGSTRSPLWRHGGKTHAAEPRDHSQKVNKKMYRGAIASILSELARTDRLKIAEAFDVSEPKTKALVAKLASLSLGKTLIVTENGSENLYLAARNIGNVAVVDVAAMDPVSLIDADHVLMTVDSVKKVEEWLA